MHLRCLLLFMACTFITLIQAQQNVGINTSTPQAQLHVEAGSILFTGPATLPDIPSDPPVQRAGQRLMWYPDKAAFRAGGVTFNHWDRDLIGYYSATFNQNTVATGNLSTAFGAYSQASGLVSTAMGVGAQARGDYSFAFNNVISKSYFCTAFGLYNDTSSISSNGWAFNDPLFIVGNGTSFSSRNNALTILKNGKTGINIVHPWSIFHIRRNGQGGIYFDNALATFASSDQSYLHLTHPNNAESGLLSGNESTSVRAGIVFGIDSSIVFRTGGNNTRMYLDKSGRLGIGINSSKALLHVRRIGASNGVTHTGSIAIFESSANSYIQLSGKNPTETGILSGNEETHIRSAVIFLPDSSMTLRTGGLNLPRLHVGENGFIGRNTTTPLSLLHIKKGSSGATVSSNVVTTIENNTSAYLEFLTPSNAISGIIASDPSGTQRSGILFQPNHNIHFNTTGNNPRKVIMENGNVGIGTTTPTANFDVQGTFKLGVSGTNLVEIKRESIQLDLPSVSAGGSYTANFTMNVGPGATAMVSPGNGLPDGLILAYARAVSGGVEAKFFNASGSSINPPSMIFHITVIR